MNNAKKIMSIGLAAALASVAVGAPDAKQDTGAQPMVPVELYACKWREGKDMGDLGKLNEKFKAMMDKNNAPYSAWMLTPQFRAGSDGFDVAWLGSWTTGAAMGKMVDNRVGGGEAAQLFESYTDVVDCSDGHMLMSSATLHAPDGPPDNGVVMFSSCTVDDDSNMEAAMKAHMKAGADIRGRGAKSYSWLFYPALGFGETDFDYYQVAAFDNYGDLGVAFDAMMGGGWAARQKLYDGVVSCDSPRAYDARLVHKAAAN